MTAHAAVALEQDSPETLPRVCIKANFLNSIWQESQRSHRSIAWSAASTIFINHASSILKQSWRLLDFTWTGGLTILARFKLLLFHIHRSASEKDLLGILQGCCHDAAIDQEVYCIAGSSECDDIAEPRHFPDPKLLSCICLGWIFYCLLLITASND